MSSEKMKMLVVDDIEINRMILSELFSEEFEVLEAVDGLTALEIIKQNAEDLSIILLDLVMPGMDGFGVLHEMNSIGLMETIPVVLITGEDDDGKILLGYRQGVSDFIIKPFNSEIVHRRVSNIVELYAHKHEMEVKLREQKEMLDRQSLKLKQTNQFVMDALSTAVEFRDLESGEHIIRIRQLTRILLEKASAFYPITGEQIEIISNASVLHDIGKIAIPDAILLKPGRLTKEEFEIMKTHTLKGCDILESLNYTQDPEYFSYCYEICRHHHERWDGRGYPDGLSGDKISIWAQATALADVYDALTSKRVYKDAYTHEEAVAMILNGECGVFNPKLLECFSSASDTLLKLSS